MAHRDTRTGGVLESMVLPALRKGGYLVQTQVVIGKRPSGGQHVVDAVATDERGKRYLVSLKWQQTSGTAEQKVPFEVICLADTLHHSSEYSAAYVVLGGPGWSLREFYSRGGLDPYLRGTEGVRIVSFEDFVARANQGKL